MTLTDTEFKKISDLVYKTCGIFLHEGKKELVNARLGKILRQRAISSFADYYRNVLEDNSGNELRMLIDCISTNQTFFFREYDHFIYLKDKIIPELMSKKEKLVNEKISIWCAGCSSGEEPYSIAILLKENFPQLNNVKIYASDISSKVLKQAVNGIYPVDKMKDVDEKIIKKYFQYGIDKWQGTLRIKNEIRNMVEFKMLNLLEPFPHENKYDIVFCRNVMIYFDISTQELITNKFYDVINPKGYLLIGHSESLSNIKHLFKYIKPTVYRKE